MEPTAYAVPTAYIGPDARVYGRAVVCGDAQVCGDAWVCGDAQVRGDGEVLTTRHVLTIGPVGPRGRTLTLHRIRGGGHRVVIGCWEGDLDALEAALTDNRPDYAPDLAPALPRLRARAAEWADDEQETSKELDR